MEANNSVFVMVNLKLFGRSSAISYRDQPAGHKISSTVQNHKSLCNMNETNELLPQKTDSLPKKQSTLFTCPMKLHCRSLSFSINYSIIMLTTLWFSNVLT